MPRPLRILQNEFPYHVCTRTNGRTFKLGKSSIKIIIKILNDVTKKYEAKIQHFQLMSNHYHLKLITPNENLDKIMHYINGQIAKKLNYKLGVKGHLWEERYKSTIISTDNYEQICVAYIYNNPVRAKLCKKASESDMLSSFEFYAKGKKIAFHVEEDSVYLMMGKTHRERMNNFRLIVEEVMSPQKIEIIKNSLHQPFFGSEEFVKYMRKKYSDYLHIKN